MKRRLHWFNQLKWFDYFASAEKTQTFASCVDPIGGKKGPAEFAGRFLYFFQAWRNAILIFILVGLPETRWHSGSDARAMTYSQLWRHIRNVLALRHHMPAHTDRFRALPLVLQSFPTSIVETHLGVNHKAAAPGESNINVPRSASTAIVLVPAITAAKGLSNGILEVVGRDALGRHPMLNIGRPFIPTAMVCHTWRRHFDIAEEDVSIVASPSIGKCVGKP